MFGSCEKEEAGFGPVWADLFPDPAEELFKSNFFQSQLMTWDQLKISDV